ncbi:MAG: 30S ribosomal protein S27ae [Candidatus Micrarchaeota archaeon]
MAEAKKKAKGAHKAYDFKRRKCPKCASGLANHADRLSCGKCGYMEKKG